MKLRMITLLGTTAAAALVASAALADTAPAPPPPPSAAPYPAMSAAIAAPAPPNTFDLGVLGKVSIGGVLSAYGQAQSNPVFGDQSSTVDLSNAQIFINKSDGVFQYFIQAGAYSTPNLSSFAYSSSSKTPAALFGNLPQGFVKIVPNSTFSVEVGALPTLVGDEYTFTFENLNIERGLLWGVEPAVSRGVQVNFAQGPFALSVAYSDGFYSKKYNSVSALATWTIDGSNTLAVDAEGPTGKVNVSNSATAPALANETIYNIMYTHTVGPWIFNPYIQYTSTPASTYFGYGKETSWGAALLVDFAFDSKSTLAGLSIPFRVEYMKTQGTEVNAANLLYGAGSNAWSFTVTPTYQYKNYFVRAEASYVTASDIVVGAAYGTNGDKKDQIRGIIETGVSF